jgi:hypothetical protein
MVYLNGVGFDHWDGTKAFLKGSISGIATSDEICVVFIYPGSSIHRGIRSTTSSAQYIYIKGTSGSYDLAANGRYIPFVNPGYYGVRIINVSGNCERWSGERDFRIVTLSTPPPQDKIHLDGVGIKYWDKNKAFLRGWIRDIVPSDEICVVFMFPGSSIHHAIPSTKSSIRYIYLKNMSGNYDLAANERYIPFEHPGNYGIRIIDVSGNCEHWSKERDLTIVKLTAQMILVPVESSNIRAIGWISPETLEVEFLSGAAYRYYYLPLNVYIEMLEASSKGKYFWQHIRCKTWDCSGGNIPYPYLRIR